LSKAEQDQIKATYTGEDGKFVYDSLISDSAYITLCCGWGGPHLF
jgi:hypothetical protein